MLERKHRTFCGEIRYWVNKSAESNSPQLVFLPGLTADHRLFEKQIAYFKGKNPVLVWDAPGHAFSWPFEFDFNLMNKAKWLDEILICEGFSNPIIIGQSFGGYVGQSYAELFPTKLKGFVSINSAPLQREYVSSIEIWLLKRMEVIYKCFPWRSLLNLGIAVSTTEYGRLLMRSMMMVYNSNKDRYIKISGHGMKMLAGAFEANLSYKIQCPALLICGKKDCAGSSIRYNKIWHKKTGIPIEWIEDAGHNSNTDAPEKVNELIERFILKYF